MAPMASSSSHKDTHTSHHMVSTSSATTTMAPSWQDDDLPHMDTNELEAQIQAMTLQDGGRQGPIYDDDVGSSPTPDNTMSLLPLPLQDEDLLCPICNGHGHIMWDCQGGEKVEEAYGVEETEPIPMCVS